MKKTIKHWRASFRDDGLAPTLFADYFAQDRAQARTISKHLPAKREGSPAFKRRRIRRIKPLNLGWRGLLAFEQALTPAPAPIPPIPWWKRAWRRFVAGMARLWGIEPKSNITHIIGGPSTPWRKWKIRWQTPVRCQCGAWALWPKDNGLKPNWCGACEREAKDRIRYWRACHV